MFATPQPFLISHRTALKVLPLQTSLRQPHSDNYNYHSHLPLTITRKVTTMDPTLANTPTPALFRFNIHNASTTTHIEHTHPVPSFLCHPTPSHQSSPAYAAAFIDVLSLVTNQHHTQCLALLLTGPCLACSGPTTDCLKSPTSYLNLVEPLVTVDVYPVCGGKVCEGKVRAVILQQRKREKEAVVESEKRRYRQVVCQVCGMEDAKRCKGCGTVGYCGKACQALDWKVHRRDCGLGRLSRKKRDEVMVEGGLPYEAI
ncbi:hypothetical protein BDR22DRAFT_845575 [Usnea florida]